ncbi:MAG: sensor domain-containing diguanylate cyclase [Sulfuricella sp.]|nr:sensor domain-containing diguanylate cyclase [Sulfuricella sp.]
MTDSQANPFEPIDPSDPGADEVRRERGKQYPTCDLALKVFRFSREAIMITDEQLNILDVNRAFTEITGYPAEEVIGRNSGFLYSSEEDVLSAAWIREKIIAQGHWQGETWGRRRNGEIFPEWLTVSTVAGKNGEVTHLINQFIDITAKKREEARFEYLAYHDPLTGLPNRILFNERLSGAIALAQRHGHSLGVLFIDLDGFKQVNDSLGHGAGDLLLQQVAKRLTQCVRESDAVARLGGDEFVVLLNELSSEHSAEGVADKILGLLHTPFVLADQRIDVSVSIGIALFPDHGADGLTLLEKADAAMYQVKTRTKNNFKMFDGVVSPWPG